MTNERNEEKKPLHHEEHRKVTKYSENAFIGSILMIWFGKILGRYLLERGIYLNKYGTL